MPELVVDDVALHYQCFGEGEDLVLIHGLGANLACWYPGVASELSQHYRVILYDIRGHGKSAMPFSGYTMTHMRRDLHVLLEHLGVTRLHVIGHSFGARVAVHYALLYPHQVATLTVADTQFRCLQPRTRLCEWSYWKIWKQELEQKGIPLPSDEEFISFRLLKHLHQASVELMQSYSGRRKRGPSLKSRDMGQKGAARWEQLMETTTAKQELDDGEQLTQADFQTIAMPTLAVYGEYSHCIPSCDNLKELMQDCQVVIQPKVGHFHPIVRPKMFVETLMQFLQAHPFKADRPDLKASLVEHRQDVVVERASL